MVWNLKHLTYFLGTILFISITTNFFMFSVLQNQPKNVNELKISQKNSEQDSSNQTDKNSQDYFVCNAE